MGTRDEVIDLTPFGVGGTYSRTEITQLGGVTVPDKIYTSPWGQGVVELANAVFLFVTLNKDDVANAQHAYLDYFDGFMFWWQSQNKQSRSTGLIVRMAEGLIPIYLFCRVRPKERGRSQPFVFCGRLSAPVMEGDEPVDCLFDVLDYVDGATGPLADVYAWRPDTLLPAPAKARRSGMARKHSGQGIQLDKELRLAIELFAMERAKQHYGAQGYDVEDTSLNRPYDLVCRKDGEVRRVEVKGTTTAGERVILTSGEVLAARDPATVTDLYVVKSIVVTRSDSEPNLSGGEMRLIAGWRPLDEDLEARQYTYSLPEQSA